MTEDAGTSRLALRTDQEGLLDDVVVRDVSMFRAEMLTSNTLWLCCYLPGTGVDGDRIAFEVTARGNELHFRVSEEPSGKVSSE